MYIKTVIRIYITAFFVVLAFSVVFFVKDIRSGKLVSDKLHFSKASFIRGKKAQAAETPTNQNTTTASSEATTNPRFPSN